MFDIATRPVPASIAASQPGTPMDWQLAPSAGQDAYPWVSYSTPDAKPVAYVDLLQTYALALEDTLQTAIVLSLFSDARAGDGDLLPFGATNRRGWVGDEFFADGQDRFGSLLWLVYYSKRLDDVLELARFYAQEALAWLVRDGIASNVTVEASWVPARSGEDRLAIRPQIYKPGQPSPVYDVLWGTTIRRGAR